MDPNLSKTRNNTPVTPETLINDAVLSDPGRIVFVMRR